MDKINMVTAAQLDEATRERDSIKTIKFNKLEIKVRQYLPIDHKIALAQDVYKLSSVVDSNGFTNVDINREDIAIVYSLIKYYTNIAVNDMDIIENYDALISSGVFKEILKSIGDEYDAVMTILHNIKLQKDIEYTKGSSLEGVLTKLPMMFATLIETAKESATAFIDTLKKDKKLTEKVSAIVDQLSKGVKENQGK